MTASFKPVSVAIGDLTAHPANVRSNSPETYDPENIAHLRASIAVLGLLQPLLVQKIDDKYAVLAGGRRHAALNELVADKAAKGFTAKTKIDCRLVPNDCDVTTALPLAENITQTPMNAIDEFEAFARMMEVDGQTPETIAKTFGTTVAAVKGRLRYGLIHPDIRAAARAKTITLDTMKAFAEHPSQEVQKEVFEALTKEDSYLQAYTVRQALKSRGVQVSDDIGAFVREDYEARGGVIASWSSGQVTLHVGLVRPEDNVKEEGARGSSSNPTGEGAPDAGEISYPASLAEDLKTERAMALGAAMALHPEATLDLTLFKLVSDVLASGMSVTQAIKVEARKEYRSHAKMDEIDGTSLEQVAAAYDALDLSWLDDSRTPDIRAHWTPNAALFNRFKKAWLLKILGEELGLAQEAVTLASSSKKEIVAFCDKLFAEPFATLTDAQRAAAAAWCPPMMQTAGGACDEAEHTAETPEPDSEVARAA